MSKQFIVVGLGQFGTSVAETLSSLGHDVMAIDKDETVIQEIADKVTYAVTLDATDENALNSLGIRNFDVGVVTIGNIQASIMVTMLLKEAGIRYIICKAMSELHKKVLLKTGADRVILPEKDMGIRVAHNLVTPKLLDYIDLTDEYKIIEINAPVQWVGKTLRSLAIRQKYGVTILAIRTTKTNLNIDPDPELTVPEDALIIAVGSVKDLKRLETTVLSDEN